MKAAPGLFQQRPQQFGINVKSFFLLESGVSCSVMLIKIFCALMHLKKINKQKTEIFLMTIFSALQNYKVTNTCLLVKLCHIKDTPNYAVTCIK